MKVRTSYYFTGAETATAHSFWHGGVAAPGKMLEDFSPTSILTAQLLLKRLKLWSRVGNPARAKHYPREGVFEPRL